MTKTLFDVLLPVQMHQDLGFSGRPLGSTSFNSEKAFSLFQWNAAFHDTPQFRYLVIRTGCSEEDARVAINCVLNALPFVSVILDAGLRSTSNVVKTWGWDVDMSSNGLFPAGINPRPMGADGYMKMSVPVLALAQAFEKSVGIPVAYLKAAEVFADVDFEASPTSRLVLLATVLELICERTRRDENALGLIDKWMEDAESSKRDDLATALDLMRQESITSCIRKEVARACNAASLLREETDRMSGRAVTIYRSRSAIVHGGEAASPTDVIELRSIVRFLLTGFLTRGVFSGARESIGRN